MTTTRVLYLSLLAVLFFSFGTEARAQQQYVPPSAQDQEIMRDMASGSGHSGPSRAGMSAEMTAAHRQRLQQQAATQSAQLLALAQKLNADLDKSNANELSVAVVKDAAEIEKLAKSIKKNAHDIRDLQKK